MACLYLVPNTLDHGSGEQVALAAVLPPDVVAVAARLTHWVAEDAKSARAFLKRVDAVQPLAQPIQAVQVQVLPRPRKDARGGGPAAGDAELKQLLEPLVQGQDMGLISEAGLPAVADPGSELVAQAHRLGAQVMPLSGPSSLMMALSASGLHGQSFAFVGYLPQDAPARSARLQDLQARSRREHQTQLLIETPYRNVALMEALVQALAPTTRLSVACGLTLAQGWCRTLTVEQWRRAMPTFDKGLPAVFAFLA